MSDGRVGGELEHHDDVLLHLILKHQWALGKETLVRQTEKGRGTERGGGGGGSRIWRQRQKDRWDREGRRYISGRAGSEQVHTLRAALGLGEELDGFELKWRALRWRHQGLSC